MPTATQSFQHRVALVFDFDETLAPSSYGKLLEHLGEDADQFKARHVDPLTDDGWEEDLAKGYALVELSRRRDEPITAEAFGEVGRSIPLFDGVAGMFDSVRDRAEEVSPGIEVEFYLLTAGFIEIPNAAFDADRFEATWGSAFHYGEDGAIECVKRLVSHPEKVRYLLALSKGLDMTGPNGPADVHREVDPQDLHVPMSQVVFVGDGSSDMDAFGLMHRTGGIALGVVDGDEAADWEGYADIHDRRRVDNLAPNDYSDGSELLRSLHLAVASIAHRVELRKLGRGE